MKQRLFLAAAVVLILGADAKVDAVKKELARFKGTWRWESIISEGSPTPPEQFKDARTIIDDQGRFTVTGAGPEFGGTFTVDPLHHPKTMDVKFNLGPEKGNVLPGIYELDGDTYRLCISLKPAGGRPTQFASKPGSGHVYEVFKRVDTAPQSFAEADHEFGLALYARLRQKPGNLFFSPFSIRTAFGMAYAGARGQTATQMSRALHFGSSAQALHETLGRIIRRLNAPAADTYELAVANSLWAQEGAPLQKEFLDLVTRHYGSSIHPVDFLHSAEAARQAINRWVEDRTKQRIRDLIPPRGVDQGTRLVLANAVYFKGLWELQFPKAATRDEPFYLEDGRSVQTPLMHQLKEVRYARGDGFQAVDLGYRGGDLSMLVLLPDKKDGLGDLETKLSARLLDTCISNMAVREVKVFLPRFTLTWDALMTTPLRELGMPLAFTPGQADFSGINGVAPPQENALYISAVFHKAFIEVNEKGTEAAAATAITMAPTAAMVPSKPPAIPIFRADHPFLFAIRDHKSGAILFLGRMADPTHEK